MALASEAALPSFAGRSLEGVTAIVGLACRFPGAKDSDSLWRSLLSGRYVSGGANAGPHAVRPRLEGMHGFDAAFFGLSELDAAVVDPQHRQFVSCAYEALEDAGVDPLSTSAVVGLFAGCALSGHLFDLLGAPGLLGKLGPQTIRHAIDKDYLTARCAHLLDLRGPCLSVQSGCATGLACIHLAANALLAGDCDVAIAGAVSLRAGPELADEPEATDPSGRCRPFDVKANGTLYGDGVGVVVLKRAADAIDSGDNIRALVLATAVNNSGSARGTFTAPTQSGQERAAREAVALSGIQGGTLGLIEAHGSGTPLGDAIELAALDATYGSGDAASAAPIALGSVKANIGNLGVAAGMAGVIKAVLALERGLIPAQPDLGAEHTAPAVRSTPFFVPTQHAPWTGSGSPRRAAVNGYGMTGTNAHLILEEAPGGLWNPREDDAPRLLVLSARESHELARMEERLAEHLARRPEILLRDAAYTLHTGRPAFPARAAYVIAPRERAKLVSLAQTRCAEGRAGHQDELPHVLLHCATPAAAQDRLSERLPAYRGARAAGASHASALLAWLQALGLRNFSVKGADPAHAPRGAAPSRQGQEELYVGTTHDDAEAVHRALLRVLGQLWVQGFELSWNPLYEGERARRVSLPSYPFTELPLAIETFKAPATRLSGISRVGVPESAAASSLKEPLQ